MRCYWLTDSFSYQLISFICGNVDCINMSTQKNSFCRMSIVINVSFFIFNLYSKLKHWHTLVLLLLFSNSVVSNSLRPHGLQHTRLPCPSLSTGVRSNSCPLSQWSRPTISSSAVPFSFCPQSFPASGSFATSWLFPLGSQSIGASVSA